MKYHEISWISKSQLPYIALLVATLPLEVTSDLSPWNFSSVPSSRLLPSCSKTTHTQRGPFVLFQGRLRVFDCFPKVVMTLPISCNHRGPRSIHGDIVLPCANPYWIHFPIESKNLCRKNEESHFSEPIDHVALKQSWAAKRIVRNPK